jgi:hypothetical protein
VEVVVVALSDTTSWLGVRFGQDASVHSSAGSRVTEIQDLVVWESQECFRSLLAMSSFMTVNIKSLKLASTFASKIVSGLKNGLYISNSYFLSAFK